MAGRSLGAVALVLTWCIGCSVDVAPPAPPKPASEPLGLQMIRLHPQLQSQRFSDLLNFETPTDTVFLRSESLSTRIDSTRAHTGDSSALIEGGNGKISVKVSSLLGDRPFPDNWTMAGAWFFSDKPARVRVTCDAGGSGTAEQMIVLQPGQWTAALVDLADAAKASGAGSGEATIGFEIAAAGRVWCDDVILIDNTKWIVGNPEAQNSWTVRQSGFSNVCEAPGAFTLRLPSSEYFAAGWKIEEASPLRLRMRSTGPQKALTIYPDGRSYWDGKFRPLSAETRSDPVWAQQVNSPGQIEIAEPMGRSVRNSPGDANNDGFDESRGTYPIAANGPRLEVKIVPGSSPVPSPVLEISGLPAGEPLITAEGRLIEHSQRLADGTLLIELPLRVDRALTVNIRIQ